MISCFIFELIIFHFVSFNFAFVLIVVMSYQEKEIMRLTKQLQVKEEGHRREQTALLHKIQLLQTEVIDYQDKEVRSKQENNSIMMSYRLNESFREQISQKEINQLIERHQEEIRKIKQKSNDDKKRMEEEVLTCKTQNQKLKIQSERVKLQFEKKIAQIRQDYEGRVQSKQNDLNYNFQTRIDILTEKLRQSEEMNNFYKEQLEKQRERANQSAMELSQQRPILEQHIPLNQDQRRLSITSKKNQDSYKILKINQQNISAINLRINRALTQLNPNKSKLQQRIRQIKMKNY